MYLINFQVLNFQTFLNTLMLDELWNQPCIQLTSTVILHVSMLWFLNCAMCKMEFFINSLQVYHHQDNGLWQPNRFDKKSKDSSLNHFDIIVIEVERWTLDFSKEEVKRKVYDSTIHKICLLGYYYQMHRKCLLIKISFSFYYLEVCSTCIFYKRQLSIRNSRLNISKVKKQPCQNLKSEGTL